jgi:hypothetical protein
METTDWIALAGVGVAFIGLSLGAYKAISAARRRKRASASAVTADLYPVLRDLRDGSLAFIKPLGGGDPAKADVGVLVKGISHARTSAATRTARRSGRRSLPRRPGLGRLQPLVLGHGHPEPPGSLWDREARPFPVSLKEVGEHRHGGTVSKPSVWASPDWTMSPVLDGRPWVTIALCSECRND